MKVNWINEKEALEKLIKEGVSYERIGRQYDVTGASVKKAARRMNIALEQRRDINPNEHFNKGVHYHLKCGEVRYCLNCGKELDGSQVKYCSNKCQMEYQKAKKINEWKKHPERFISESGYEFVRNYLLEKYDNKCEKCGWGEENQYTHSVPLEVHHIDGDCTNNREDNLQLLCPNCHSLTENFGSRNKGSKRYKLMEYKRKLRE
jgi:hypothetical protein